MEFETLKALRLGHPGWRLLRAEHAALVASYLFRAFLEPNVRTLAFHDAVAVLDDHLFKLRATEGDPAFPRSASQYLDEWAGEAHGWLRKYYPLGSDEPHLDLTMAAEKALDWLASLRKREFVGTESRLLTVFDLLRQLVEGSQSDPEARLADLQSRRAVLDAQIEAVQAGRIDVMDPVQVKDRFQQVVANARGLLSDFREVEQNFRELDRNARERIATWHGGKAELLDQLFGKRDAIADSDEGKSFRAFWDFLMTPARQEQLTALLEAALRLEPVRALEPDPRFRRIHYDWLHAGDQAQRTVARLSQQLRRYLDDRAFLENRRIVELVRRVEDLAVAIRENPPEGMFAEIDDTAPQIELPFERPLFAPPHRARLNSQIVLDDGTAVPADALFAEPFVDRAVLEDNIRLALRSRESVSLGGVVQQHPLSQGLAELLGYLNLAADDHRAMVHDSRTEKIGWQSDEVIRTATLPLVVFSR